MLEALKSFIGHGSDDEKSPKYVSSSSPKGSPSHSNIFSYTVKTEKLQKPLTPEAVIVEEDVMEEVFDFEKFHKSINQKKAKTQQVVTIYHS